MRLPYLQLEADFVTSKAAMIAARAGVSEITALGMGVKLFTLAVTETGDRERPPDGYFADPDAADVIEHLLGWTGERGRLVTAFERAGVIERLEVGLRVRGLDRYRRTWEKNTRKPGAAGAGKVPETGTEPAGKAPVAARQTQTQTQTHKKQLQPAVPEAAMAHMVWQAGEWEARFACPAGPPPTAEFLAWFEPAMADMGRLGRGEEDLRAAYRAFLADPYWATKSRRRCPWAAWVKQWKDFLPAASPPPGGMVFREVKPGEDIYAEDAA